MHLGMSGRFEIAKPDARRRTIRPGEFHYAPDPDPKHAHVVFETEDGARVTYYDPRRFGFMDADQHRDPAPAPLVRRPWARAAGPDAFDAAHLKAAFADRKQGPKTLLLDQRTVAGLGNIYVCEALHRARISPFKPAGGVAGKRWGRWSPPSSEVLTEADRGRRLDLKRLRPPTARSAISSTASASTTARASRARRKAARG
jgi:formamidopyrimidine-DNA glycosylase